MKSCRPVLLLRPAARGADCVAVLVKEGRPGRWAPGGAEPRVADVMQRKGRNIGPRIHIVDELRESAASFAEIAAPAAL